MKMIAARPHVLQRTIQRALKLLLLLKVVGRRLTKKHVARTKRPVKNVGAILARVVHHEKNFTDKENSLQKLMTNQINIVN